jgi:putative transport protein
VLIDETWAKTNVTHTHGRALRGQYLVARVPHSRRDGVLIAAAGDMQLHPGDILAIAGRTGWVTEFAHLRLGAERDDADLLDMPVETLDVMVTKTPAGRDPGDVVTLVGAPERVEASVARIGFAEEPSVSTDMFTLGSGIAWATVIRPPSRLRRIVP